MKPQSRLKLLIKVVNRALELPRASRFALAMDLVDAVDRLGFAEVLALEGLTFARTDDVHNDARINAQKLFRWLGQYENQHAQADRLFYVEVALLAALPEDLRLLYLNELYAPLRVTVVADQSCDGKVVNVLNMAAMLTKENSEAQVAVIHLGTEPNREQLEAAHRELRESAASTTASMAALELAYPFLAQKVGLRSTEQMKDVG